MRSSISKFQEETAPEVEQRDEDWFLSQLFATCQDIRYTNKDFLIVCPFHADSNPSCHVDRHSGMYHCFSCSAGGHWNKLAEAIGAEKIHFKKAVSNISDIKDQMSRSLTKAGVKPRRSNKKKGSDTRPLVSEWPDKDSWRSVGGPLLSALGCVKVNDLVHRVTRIGLPIRDLNGHLLGYTCRAIDPEDSQPKYVPLSATKVSWRPTDLPVREAIFLLEVIQKTRPSSVVITEGPYDALHLLASSIPAIAILGTSSWTPEKAATIMGLGIDRVFILMDSDKSGRKAKGAIMRSLKGKIEAKSIKLPKSADDPGKLKPKHLDWLRGLVTGTR